MDYTLAPVSILSPDSQALVVWGEAVLAEAQQLTDDMRIRASSLRGIREEMAERRQADSGA